MKQRGKAFLSDHEGEGGSITWSVKTTGVESYIGVLESTLRITDCHKQVELDFDCYEYRHVKKRVDKIDRLMLELCKMKESLLLAEKELAPKKFYY